MHRVRRPPAAWHLPARAALVLVLMLLCVACAHPAKTAPVAPVPARLWQDSAFKPVQLPELHTALTASEAMRAYLRHELAPTVRRDGARRALAEALMRKGWLRLEYDAEATRTAAEAFDARAGNCLSLVLMTAALARELGLELRFQEVHASELWSRSADLYVASGHINVTLGRQALGSGRSGYDAASQITIDFLPAADVAGYRRSVLTESTVLAMFANNRAAEALTRGDLDLAYAWLRAGLREDPRFMTGYNTLALIYLQRGLPEAAEQVLREVLQHEPGHLQALGNLVVALHAQGKADQAEIHAQALADAEPNPPFKDFERGQAALKAGDAASARQFFLREMKRDPDYHEFHLALAQAEWMLGRPAEAERQLELAERNSPGARWRGLYAAKLSWLRAQQRATAR